MDTVIATQYHFYSLRETYKDKTLSSFILIKIKGLLTGRLSERGLKIVQLCFTLSSQSGSTKSSLWFYSKAWNSFPKRYSFIIKHSSFLE